LCLASSARPGGIALHLAAPSAATARIPPRHGAVRDAGARAMALRIGDIADTSQLLDSPWRRRKQPQRKPPPHYRRRNIAGRCRLPYREEGAVLNLVTPTHHSYGSGLHRSPSHRSPSNALDQHLRSPTRRMVTPARRVGSSWRSRERPARHRSGAGSSPGRTNRLHAECPPRHRNESRPDRKSLGYESAGRPFIGHQPKRTDVSPRHR
jgi:hypothetical protein